MTDADLTLEQRRRERADCRYCGEHRLVWVFGCCRTCANNGNTRALVLAEIRAELKRPWTPQPTALAEGT